MLNVSPMPAPTLFLNDFTVLDFAFLHRTHGITGDSYFVSAELEGELDEKDFLFDFGPAKKLLKALVDDALDHRLLVPGIARTSELRTFEGLLWQYESPEQAVAFFPAASEITPAIVEQELARLAMAKLPGNVKAVRFFLRSLPRFEHEPNFRYTHGLRFHDGNCQRLFHGHRNPIEVWRGGARDVDSEILLASEWDHAHFAPMATVKNLRELDLPLGRRVPAHPGTAHVEYRSAQGFFRGSFPASRLVVTESEPSVETISMLALSNLRASGIKGSLRVVAYEGLNKGAVSQSV